MPKLLVGSKFQVYNGTAESTSGGLVKKDIIKVVKDGVTRYKSKVQTSNGKKKTRKSQKARSKWTDATKKAYKFLQDEDSEQLEGYPATKITKQISNYFSESFVSMIKTDNLKKAKPSNSERLYIITRLFYEGKL